MATWAYRSDGSIDRAFGRDGEVLFGAAGPKGPRFTPAAAVQQADGKIVVAGERRRGRGGVDLELARFRFPGSR